MITPTAKHRCEAIVKSITKATILVGTPIYARPGTSVTSTNSSNSSNPNDGFAQSMVLGFAMNNGMLGGLIGGSIAGGMVGDAMNGDLWD